MTTTILSIANSDTEIALSVPKHPDAHAFLYKVLDELGIEHRPIVDDRGAERIASELSDTYALYESDTSSVSAIWAREVVFLLVRPLDRERFAAFLTESTRMHLP